MPQLELPRCTRSTLPGVLALVIGIVCSACSVAPQHAANATDLEASYSFWQEGQLKPAATFAERVLARTGAPKTAAQYARQRYYATILMMLAHESASFGEEQFETEGKRYLSHVFGGSQGSPNAHLVATAYHAHQGRLGFENAVADSDVAQSEAGPVQMIPSALSAFDLQATQDHVNLTMVMVDTRLGFTSRSNDHLRTLTRAHQISDLDTCNAFLDQARFPESGRPWIYYAMFQFLKDTGGDQKEAYRFGISARQAAEDAHSGFRQEAADGIADWIDHESNYVFKCACPKPFDRTTDRCLVCGAKNIIFEGTPRP